MGQIPFHSAVYTMLCIMSNDICVSSWFSMPKYIWLVGVIFSLITFSIYLLFKKNYILVIYNCYFSCLLQHKMQYPVWKGKLQRWNTSNNKCNGSPLLSIEYVDECCHSCLFVLGKRSPLGLWRGLLLCLLKLLIPTTSSINYTHNNISVNNGILWIV